MARPTKLTHELADKICDSISGGVSLRKTCAGEGMPALSSVLLWVVKGSRGEEKYAWFSDQYREARGANGEAHGDRVADLVENMLDDPEMNPQMVKVAIDGLKWSAERMAPKSYGPKTQLTGDGGGPIETKELSANDMARKLAFVLTEAAAREEQSAN